MMGLDRLGERNKLQVQETKGRQHMVTDQIKGAKEMEPIQVRLQESWVPTQISLASIVHVWLMLAGI